MQQQAYKFLLHRVNGHRPQRKTVEPEKIKAARQVVKDYEHADYLKENAFRESVERARNEAKEVVHAGDYDAALKAIKTFEAMTFKDQR